MSKTFCHSAKMRGIIIQIIVGVVAAALETATMQLFNGRQPLYMDCIWTMASSFYSPISGLICAIFSHIFAVWWGFVLFSSLVFIVCSVTVVITVRLFVRFEKALPTLATKFAGLVMLVIVQTFLISIEGGLLYIWLFEATRNGELSSTNTFVFALFLQNVPYAVAAILGRIPMNLADKAIAVFTGYGIWRVGGGIYCKMKIKGDE